MANFIRPSKLKHRFIERKRKKTRILEWNKALGGVPRQPSLNKSVQSKTKRGNKNILTYNEHLVRAIKQSFTFRIICT